MPWCWLDEQVVLAIHGEQIAEHGGASGIRDQGLLQSALARALHLAAYGDPDVADLAATYAHGIVRSHPFVDGNKREAFVCLELFLDLNGHALVADDADCVVIMLRLAAGEIGEEELAGWIRSHVRPRED
jgi:death-on-curing protein